MKIDTIAYRNRLYYLAPEQKVIFALVVLLIALISSIPTQIIIILWMGVWTIIYAKISANFYLKLLGLTSLFLLMSLPALLIHLGARENINLSQTDQLIGINLGAWYVYLSRSGSEQALIVTMRSLAGTSCLFFLLCTVPFLQLLSTLRRFRVPTILTELLLLMYRFVFLLLKTATEIRIAQMARGGDRTWKIKMNSAALLVKQLLLRTLQRYRQFSLAVAARGFREEFAVYSLETTKFSGRYALEAILGCCSLLGLELWLRLFYV